MFFVILIFPSINMDFKFNANDSIEIDEIIILYYSNKFYLIL